MGGAQGEARGRFIIVILPDDATEAPGGGDGGEGVDGGGETFGGKCRSASCNQHDDAPLFPERSTSDMVSEMPPGVERGAGPL